MATAQGKRINALTRADELPNNVDYAIELPGNEGTRKVSQRLINKTVYENLKTGTDEDVEHIIEGTYEDPESDDWGTDDD